MSLLLPNLPELAKPFGSRRATVYRGSKSYCQTYPLFLKKYEKGVVEKSFVKVFGVSGNTALSDSWGAVQKKEGAAQSGRSDSA